MDQLILDELGSLEHVAHLIWKLYLQLARLVLLLSHLRSTIYVVLHVFKTFLGELVELLVRIKFVKKY